jgi:hypothetical protein
MFALPLSALAAETTGTVKSVDSQSFTLEDGTQLWLSEGQAAEITPGEKVQAMYEIKGDRKVVTELERLTTGPEGQITTNLGSRTGNKQGEVESPGQD